MPVCSGTSPFCLRLLLGASYSSDFMLTVALSISDADLSFCPPCVVQLPAELGLFFSGEERLGSSAMKGNKHQVSTAIRSLEEYTYMYQQEHILYKWLDKFYLTGYSHHVKVIKQGSN